MKLRAASDVFACDDACGTQIAIPSYNKDDGKSDIAITDQNRNRVPNRKRNRPSSVEEEEIDGNFNYGSGSCDEITRTIPRKLLDPEDIRGKMEITPIPIDIGLM